MLSIRSLTLASKIKGSLLCIALILLAANMTLSYLDDKALSQQLVEDKLESLAVNYFDSVNTMMLTGTMANRELLQQKILTQDAIIEAKIIRGEQVVKLYGPGLADQVAKSPLEHEALNGVKRFVQRELQGSDTLEFVMPLQAGKEHLGEACLGCHQATPGEVLGAVKISYDLSKINRDIRGALTRTALLQLALTLICFLLLYLAINKLLLTRLKRLRLTINSVEQELDLSRKIPVHHKDELGAVSIALNSMMSKFKSSFQSISSTSEELVHAAREVDQLAVLTKEAVLTQKSGTVSVAAAINQLDASANEVKLSTLAAADKSDTANQSAVQGLSLVDNTQQGILELREQVQKSTEMIDTLNQKTTEIGSILDIIISIADQTNLLALNAAIEAARAGEHGRGFAVVADEVRILATRTRHSIDQIQSTIDSLQTEAGQAVGSMKISNSLAVEKADEVMSVANLLHTICEQIDELDQLNGQIASAAQQQNLAADEINLNVVKISDVADQSSDDAVKGAQISEQMLTLASQLQAQVAKFKR